MQNTNPNRDFAEIEENFQLGWTYPVSFTSTAAEATTSDWPDAPSPAIDKISG
jgi:hypothetical protein